MLEELAAIQEDAADTDVEEQVAADTAASMVEAKEEAAEDATAINVTAAPVELLAPAAAENVTATNMTAVPVLGDSSTEDSSEADVPAVDPAVNTTATEEACSPNVVEILLANEGNDLLTAYNATLALPEYAAAAEDNAENNPNFTLYAPTDAAVEALAGRLGVEPEALLGADYLDTTAEIVWYHSVSDGGCGLDDAVTDCPALVAGDVVVGACNNASVVAGPFADCLAENGEGYLISEVLPPALCNGSVIEAETLL